MTAAPLSSNPFPVLISKEQIAQKVVETARQIEQDYQGKELVILAVMKGAICLVADLIREIKLPLTLESIQCSSYGANGTQRGPLTIFGLERLMIAGKDVLLVDDIFDTGHTMQGLYDALVALSPRSLKSCVLLKKNIPHSTPLRLDYTLFTIENEFVIGYGLDYKELYRGLQDVCVLHA